MLLLKDKWVFSTQIGNMLVYTWDKGLVSLLLIIIQEIKTLITRANLHFKPIRFRLFQRFQKKSCVVLLGEIQLLHYHKPPTLWAPSPPLFALVQYGSSLPLERSKLNLGTPNTPAITFATTPHKKSNFVIL